MAVHLHILCDTACPLLHRHAPPQPLPRPGQTAAGRRGNRAIAEAVGLSPFAHSQQSPFGGIRPFAAFAFGAFAGIRPFAHSRHSPFAAVSFGAVWPGLAPAQSPFAAVARRGRSNCWEAGLPEVDCYSHSATSPRCEADCREVDWSVISLTSLCRGHSASLARRR